jgi:hypothetical protein
MKKLYTLLLLALLSISAYGQHFVVGVQGGASFNSVPSGTDKYFYSVKSSTTSIAGIRAGWDMKKIAVGLGYNSSKVNYDCQIDKANIWSVHVTAPVTNVYAYLRFKKNFVRSYIYLGITAGYIRIGENKTTTTFRRNPPYVFSGSVYPDQKGITGGLHAGYHFHIIQGLGIFGEAGAVYSTATAPLQMYDISGNSLGYYNKNGYLSFPVMAGIDYRF